MGANLQGLVRWVLEHECDVTVNERTSRRLVHFRVKCALVVAFLVLLAWPCARICTRESEPPMTAARARYFSIVTFNI